MASKFPVNCISVLKYYIRLPAKTRSCNWQICLSSRSCINNHIQFFANTYHQQVPRGLIWPFPRCSNVGEALTPYCLVHHVFVLMYIFAEAYWHDCKRNSPEGCAFAVMPMTLLPRTIHTMNLIALFRECTANIRSLKVCMLLIGHIFAFHSLTSATLDMVCTIFWSIFRAAEHEPNQQSTFAARLLYIRRREIVHVWGDLRVLTNSYIEQ